MARKKKSKQRAKPALPILSNTELPSVTTTRWVARRKAQVVEAVHDGTLSLEEACIRYALTREEFLGWERAIKKFGLPGLRATHAQEYRVR